MPFNDKAQHVQQLITQALDILNQVGIPMIGKSSRGMEKMAMSLLAVAGVTTSWIQVKGASKDRRLKTREIISFINQHYGENISPGSYDDIRRKDLKLPVLASLIINSGDKGRATNDPTRGYSIEADFEKLIMLYNTDEWEIALKNFLFGRETLTEALSRERSLEKIPVLLPGNKSILLSLGKHNDLQKNIIEQFLPRYGHGCKVLYIGDTSNKMLHIESTDLKNLNFFELSHDELPDIIAYNDKKNWLYLIEAVHSSGPISEIRLLEMKLLLKNCPAELIFVTAFLNSRLNYDEILYIRLPNSCIVYLNKALYS
ncbi:restriction endonuclease, partial [bacterium]